MHVYLLCRTLPMALCCTLPHPAALCRTLCVPPTFQLIRQTICAVLVVSTVFCATIPLSAAVMSSAFMTAVLSGMVAQNTDDTAYHLNVIGNPKIGFPTPGIVSVAPDTSTLISDILPQAVVIALVPHSPLCPSTSLTTLPSTTILSLYLLTHHLHTTHLSLTIITHYPLHLVHSLSLSS